MSDYMQQLCNCGCTSKKYPDHNLSCAFYLKGKADRLSAENGRMRKALHRINRWFGEFPESGQTWADGSPMSYGIAFGSNGERDFMRNVARNALLGVDEESGNG